MKKQLAWILAMLCFAVPSLFAAEALIVVPMDLRHNLPFVQVMVNGKGPFTFGIDTGTGGEALATPDLIQQLGLPVTGETEVGDPSGHNPQKARIVQINSLKLREVEFHNVKAVEFQPTRMLGNCDGILGFVLFRDYLFTLDYPQGQLRLAHGALTAGDGVIPFRIPNDVPLIELHVGTQKIDAHLDSRGMGLSIPEKFAQDLKFVSAPIIVGRGRTVSSDFEIKSGQLASDIQLAGYTLAQPFIAINPVFPVGNVGSAVLRNFAVTFDQKNLLVRFAAKDKNIVIPPPPKPPSMPQAH